MAVHEQGRNVFYVLHALLCLYFEDVEASLLDDGVFKSQDQVAHQELGHIEFLTYDSADYLTDGVEGTVQDEGHEGEARVWVEPLGVEQGGHSTHGTAP